MIEQQEEYSHLESTAFNRASWLSWQLQCAKLT